MAAKILTLRLTALLVPTHYEFHRSILELLEDDGSGDLRIDDLMASYKSEIKRLFAIVNRKRGSLLTQELQTIDEKRDRVMGELFNIVNAASTSVNPTRSEAAAKLTRIISPYRGVAQNEYNKQTAQVRGLLRELADKETQKLIAVLTLGDTVTLLDTLNKEFAEKMDLRAEEFGAASAEVEGIDTRTQRRAVDDIYHTITEKLNAMALLEPKDTLLEKIEKINGYILEYRQVLAGMRAGGTGQEKGTSNKSADDDGIL